MSDTADRVLWGCTTARTIRAHWALHELGLRYRCEPILPRSGETQTSRYTAVNPRQKIPALQDGDFTITESAAIINYLSATYGRDGNRLVPTDPRGRARYDEWCFFIVCELDATSLYILRRHVGLPQVYGEAPTAVEAATTYFQKQVQTVAAALDDGRRWLLGEAFSGADMLLTTCLDWALRYELPLTNGLLAFRDRATARPAYAAAQQANRPEYWKI
ncbi:glutathione S-transferase family protein [Siccirubricoccus sp. G192]|uniref:glutathione S-transferase family protein n=1 Tax=Siccirubricoccus sp. G192 TaxID=2849651 RepID=UPI001C2CA486|nr:glutathione S-transferase family protein [Siccirubricoccus sp. G192]MBV1796519.1 glutathione S-transferase family protein [Siccirubricoccus sp. G192]